MKKMITILPVLFGLALSSAMAATVTVDQDNQTTTITTPSNTTVTMPATNSTVTVQTTPATTVVPVVAPVAYVATRDPREVEGEIIKVDYPANQILVRDIDGHEKRITLKTGMISGYKVDDYVKIYLMADMKEAKTIQTLRTTDIDGEIVNVDYVNNLVIIRHRDGRESTVLFTPILIRNYKAGDYVRLYVVPEYNQLQEARVIRVR